MSKPSEPAGSIHARIGRFPVCRPLLVLAASPLQVLRPGCVRSSPASASCTAGRSRYALAPADQVRVAFVDVELREHAVHHHAAVRIEVDVGERVASPASQAVSPSCFSTLSTRVLDLVGGVGEVRLGEARARGRPFLALVGQRDVARSASRTRRSSMLRAMTPTMRCQPCIET